MSQWTPPNQYPYSPPTGGYTYTPYYAPKPETPQQQEAKRLRKDANYTGLLMLGLTAGTQLTFTVVVLILCFAGVISFNDINHSTLGLSNTAYLLLYAVVYTVAMAVPAVLVSLCCKRRQFPLSPAKPVSGGVAFWGVLGAMGVCMVANFVTSYIVALFQQFGVSAPEMPDMMENTTLSLLLNILVLAVLPALLEEMVFRGYILRAMRPYGNWYAVFVSSLLFSLMHGNIEQIPFSFIVGLALGWLLVYTDNIWLPVAVHFCNNALSVLMQYFGDRFPTTETQGVFNLLVIVCMGLVGLIGFGVLALRHREMFRRLPRRSLLTVSNRIGNLFLSPAWVIAVAVMLLLTVWSTK